MVATSSFGIDGDVGAECDGRGAEQQQILLIHCCGLLLLLLLLGLCIYSAISLALVTSELVADSLFSMVLLLIKELEYLLGLLTPNQ